MCIRNHIHHDFFYCPSLTSFYFQYAVYYVYLFIYWIKLHNSSKLSNASSRFYLHFFPFTNILVVVTRRRQPHIAEGQLSLWLPTTAQQKEKCNIFNRDTLKTRLTLKLHHSVTRVSKSPWNFNRHPEKLNAAFRTLRKFQELHEVSWEAAQCSTSSQNTGGRKVAKSQGNCVRMDSSSGCCKNQKL